MGITVAPLAAIMGSVATHYAGTASGVNNAVAHGGVLAIAMVGSSGAVCFAGHSLPVLPTSLCPTKRGSQSISSPPARLISLPEGCENRRRSKRQSSWPTVDTFGW